MLVSGRGIFEIYVEKFSLASDFNTTACCSKIERDFLKSRLGCCKLRLKICLGAQENICDIGSSILIPVDSYYPNTTTYTITVNGSWKKQFYVNFQIMKQFDHKVLKAFKSLETNFTPSDSWSNKSWDEDDVILVVSYRGYCSRTTYGQGCDRLCIPTDSAAGHYNCDRNGNKICKPGWIGKYCKDPVCKNKCVNGHRVAPNTCRCNDGWNGTACEQCIAYPGCKNGRCKIMHGKPMPLTCDCEPGFIGMFCNIDAEFCRKHVNICKNGGTCENIAELNV